MGLQSIPGRPRGIITLHNGPPGSAQHLLHIVSTVAGRTPRRYCSSRLAGWMDVVGDVDSGAEAKTLRAGFAAMVAAMGDAGRACRWHVSIQSWSCFQSGTSRKHGRVLRRPDRRWWPCSGYAGGLTGCEALVVVGLLQM